jgi:signal transduction histidine kinase
VAPHADTELVSKDSVLSRWRARTVGLLRDVPTLVVDAGIALACYVAAVATALSLNCTQWWVMLLAALASLPLIWRRRYPIPVTAALGVGTTGLALAHATEGVPFGQLVATYTFASLSGPPGRLLGVLGTVVGVFVSMVIPSAPVTAFPVVGTGFAGAYALGTGVRARRDRIALLEERTRLLAKEQAVTAAQERERIARDMHDILAHSVSLIVVQAEAGPVVLRSDPDRAEAAFDTIAATGREALAQLRRALGVLRAEEASRHPQPDLGALPALAQAGREAGLEVSLEQHGAPRPVPAEVGAAAYRVVQESLTNVIKHAQASRVWIRLEWDGDHLRVDVRDDGRGRAGPGGSDGHGRERNAGQGPGGGNGRASGPPDGAAGGQGLVGMRERVAACGGRLSAGPSQDGGGFRVAATLPAPAGPDA